MNFIAGLTLGFLGSFHCIGMCGPIAMALPTHSLSRPMQIAGILLYNLGRVCTYAIIGLLFGLLGEGIYLGGMQQIISIIAGAFIIISVVVKIKVPTLFSFPFIKRSLQYFFISASFPSLFMLGLINGLLPCGFVYMALAGAMLSGDVLGGGVFMMAFGFGTIPAMLAMSFTGSFAGLGTRNKIKKLIPYISILIGLLLIIRGLNLNVPYLSPGITHHESHTEVSCCRK